MNLVLESCAPPAPAPGIAGLRLRSVTAGYGEVVVLRDVTFEVPYGEVVAVLGANGAGKTTLLRTIFGATSLRAGTIELDGHDIGHRTPYRIARLGLCYVPEGRAVYPRLTVEENLRLFLGGEGRGRSGGKKFDAARSHVYGVFPVLAERSRQLAGTLSGGQQQMLALSRSLVRDFRILLVDELSMGLAPVVIDELFEVLNRLKDAGLTTVIVEQYVERALGAADVVHVMARGRIVLSGETAELRDSPELLSLYLDAGDADR